ncbi:MAG: hydrogenase subunit MbhD domain-containing protein [Bacteroidota bacterium]|nr:hydrogenase subunit MbhD domain-containing protein [Bacteroidota bacterium]
MINLLIAIIIGILILIMAIVAIHNKNLVVGIIAAGAVSLFASILYLLLAAPDVAMTEAAIGSGLSTIIFFYVLNKIKKQNG